MKQDFTSITVLLDCSGSMNHLATDTIGSFNTFVKEQKAFPGEVAFTLCRFNTQSDVVHDFKKLASVPDLTTEDYCPSGSTALLDAMGEAIESVGSKLSALPEEERPSKVLFLIITDGQENASRHFSATKIKEMVKHQEDVYSWNFVFMGANIDSLKEGTNIGLRGVNTMNYIPSAAGTKKLYSTMSKSTQTYRSSNIGGKVDFFNQDANVASPVDPKSK